MSLQILLRILLRWMLTVILISEAKLQLDNRDDWIN